MEGNTTKNKNGKFLEQIVSFIEQALSTSTNTTFETNKRIIDLTTGRLREFDIIITIKERHHEVKIAVECRDHSRPVGVTQVESFVKKCQDTGINQGIIVSSKGFYDTARRKAEFHQIRCFSLKEITNSLSWLPQSTLRMFQRKVNSINFNIILGRNTPPEFFLEPIDPKDLVDSSGNQITEEILLNTIREEIDKASEEFEKSPNIERDDFGPIDGIVCRTFLIIDGEGIFLKNEETNINKSIIRIEVTITYEIISRDIPVTKVEYVDINHKDQIANAVLLNTTMNFRGKNEQLMIVNIGENKIRLVLMPSAK